MRSRSAALAVLVIGLALAAWMGFAWNRARQVAPRELEVTGLSPPFEREHRDGAVVIAPAATPNTGDADSSPQREGLGGEEELTGRVRVVFETDKRPAAGVDVYWFGSEQLALQRWRDDLDELGMGLDFVSRNGRHFVTDADGLARVPSSSGRIQVVATTPAHFGMTSIERGGGSDEPIALSLRAAFGVDVRVRGERSQEPVRDVVVVASCSQLPQSRVGARTDERGIARLFPLFHDDDPRGNWYASLPGVFFDEIRVPLPMQERSAPLELVLPESAPAVVRIVDKQGDLYPLSGTLLIGWNDREADPAEPRQVRISEGIANLTRIESGLTLHVRAQFSDNSESPTSVFTLDKPSSARVKFDLVVEKSPTPTRD